MMKTNSLRKIGGIKLVSAAATLLLMAGSAQASVIDLGPASGYSGFFFGNVNAASDVEGRLAVGGNLTGGFDIGYRNAYGSTQPSLVVKGGVSLTNSSGGPAGTVYNGPNTDIDTNAGIGPSEASWVPGALNFGQIVYGSSLTARDWQYGSAVQNASYLDFGAAKTQLSGLSTQLASLSANGSFQALPGSGGLKLTGDGSDNPQVFNLGNTSLATTITLENVKAGAHVIINSTLSNVVLSGDYGGHQVNSSDALAQHRDRILYNFSNATSLNVASFINGSVLAVKADVIGSGHLEGTLIANSLSAGPNGRLELGYEPFVPTTPVPEPASVALMLAGLGAIGLFSRRRSQAQT